ncbi:MAG: cadherin-like beta sandwich domain-containing protein [Lachnospiraceae bacterium]|nr:cadherin-like beta sandwich domain-containing protein [Lachnospiraceae bacterium]
MRNYYKRFTSVIKPLVMMLVMLVTMIPQNAYAASINVSVTGGTIEQGETVSVTLNLSSSAVIGAYRLYLTYDSSVIEYTPSAGDDSFCNGGAGTLVFVGDPYATSDSKTIKFKGIKAGTSKLTISYDAGDILDDQYNDMTVSATSGSVTVNAPREASPDATLKGLSVGEGSLSPAFSADVTEYSISVGAGVGSLTISATPNSSYAKVSISGNELKEGDNTVKVTVTAENGNQKVYSIYVNKAKATPSPTPEPTSTPTPSPTPTPGAEVTVNNLGVNEQGEAVLSPVTLIVENKITVNVPAGFDMSSVTIQGHTVEALKLNDGDVTLVQLSDGNLYVYDSAAGTYDLYQTIDTLARHYRISMAPEEEIPTGYTLTTIELNGAIYPAYRLTAEDEFLLIYVEGGQWYKYDTVENTIQRYDSSEDKVVVITQIPEAQATPTGGAQNTPTDRVPTLEPATGASATGVGNDGPGKTDIVKIVLIILVFLLAILFMILYVRERNRNLKYLSDEEEELKEARENTESEEEDFSQYADETTVSEEKTEEELYLEGHEAEEPGLEDDFSEEVIDSDEDEF